MGGGDGTLSRQGSAFLSLEDLSRQVASSFIDDVHLIAGREARDSERDGNSEVECAPYR